jgi:hypothetical protein
MAYQPQVPADTLSSASRGYKQYTKFAELDGLDGKPVVCLPTPPGRPVQSA